MLRAHLVVALLLVGAASPFVAVGCQDFDPAVPCGEIPAGGCPTGRGGTCTDPTCTGLYACVSGVWTSVQACGPHDGGTEGGSTGAGGTGGGLPDAGPCTPANIDTTGETMGCTPDLENPDCPVEVALGCAERACLTGCLDFFLCKSGVWTDVAYCDDEGNLVITQPAHDAGP